MNDLASFMINHDILQKGMYISRVDGDVVTYDIRMKRPNKGDYLDNGAIHTFEHLFATYVRSGPQSDKIIYVGPMGCRTGFYFIVRDTLSHAAAIRLVQECVAFIRDFDEPEIPGAKHEQCGNYLNHDLTGAQLVAADMCGVLENWTVEKLQYEG